MRSAGPLLCRLLGHKLERVPVKGRRSLHNRVRFKCSRCLEIKSMGYRIAMGFCIDARQGLDMAAINKWYMV